jgi:hypothetical protein
MFNSSFGKLSLTHSAFYLPRALRNALAVLMLPFVGVATFAWNMFTIGLTVFGNTGASSPNTLNAIFFGFIVIVGPIAGVIGYLRWWLFTRTCTSRRALLATLACCLCGLLGAVFILLVAWGASNWFLSSYVIACYAGILIVIGELIFLTSRSRSTRLGHPPNH